MNTKTTHKDVVEELVTVFLNHAGAVDELWFRHAITLMYEKGKEEANDKIEKLRKTDTFPQSLTTWNGKTKYFDRLSDHDIAYNHALDDILQALNNN